MINQGGYNVQVVFNNEDTTSGLKDIVDITTHRGQHTAVVNHRGFVTQ